MNLVFLLSAHEMLESVYEFDFSLFIYLQFVALLRINPYYIHSCSILIGLLFGMDDDIH